MSSLFRPPKWWRRRALPPGPQRLFHAPFIAIVSKLTTTYLGWCARGFKPAWRQSFPNQITALTVIGLPPGHAVRPATAVRLAGATQTESSDGIAGMARRTRDRSATMPERCSMRLRGVVEPAFASSLAATVLQWTHGVACRVVHHFEQTAARCDGLIDGVDV